MKRTEALKKIAIYLFQPEDTTEMDCNRMSADCLLLETCMPWLGMMKAVFWTMAAVVCPLALYLFFSRYFL